MENKPSYEELLRLYKAEQDKNTKLEKALSEKKLEINIRTLKDQVFYLKNYR